MILPDVQWLQLSDQRYSAIPIIRNPLHKFSLIFKQFLHHHIIIIFIIIFIIMSWEVLDVVPVLYPSR
jgi:hypothetical protein